MALNATAFLLHGEHLFYSESKSNPVGEILEYIWFSEPSLARTITRNRIHTRLRLSPLCHGMLKVVGKRYSLLDDQEFSRLFESSKLGLDLILTSISNDFWKFPFNDAEQELNIESAMNIAIKLADQSPNRIGAILLDQDFKMVSWGWNDHFKNRVLHAELMMVKNYCSKFNKLIPVNHTLVTTLFPCAMCAGYLNGNSEDFSSLNIIYLENDPGPFAQNSILIPGSHLHSSSGITAIPRIHKYKALTTIGS